MKLAQDYRHKNYSNLVQPSLLTKNNYSQMKKYYKILSLAILIALTALQSCTKQDSVYDSDNQGGIIELANLPSRTTSTVYSIKNSSFDAVDAVSFPITVNYTGTGGAPEDITVTMAIDTAALTKYNTASGTDFTTLPATLYTVPTFTLTILKGQKTATLDFTLKTSSFDFSESYALPIAIKSATAGTISSNYGTGIFAVVAKNRWDGVYTVTNGTMVDVTTSTLSHINNYLSTHGEDNMEYSLTTISATKCVLYDDYFFGGYYSGISSGTSYSNYGSFCAILEFDPATNKVIGVTNYYGQPVASNTRYGRLDPTGINTYDPATKVIEVKYNMCQPSVVAASPYVRSTWTETLTYKSARP